MSNRVVEGFLEDQKDFAADIGLDRNIPLGSRTGERKLDAAGCKKIVGKLSHALSQVDQVVAPGLIAHTMSDIESTSSRETPAMTESRRRTRSSAGPTSRRITSLIIAICERLDPISSMKVCSNSRSHPLNLDQPPQAITV